MSQLLHQVNELANKMSSQSKSAYKIFLLFFVIAFGIKIYVASRETQ